MLCCALGAWLFFSFLMVPSAKAQSPFSGCYATTSNSATIVIETSATISVGGGSIAAGDQIAVVDGTGRCAGVATWSGSDLSINVVGDEGFTPAVDGMTEGAAMLFRVWDQSADVTYSASAGYQTAPGPPYRDDGIYGHGALYDVTSVTTDAVLPVELTDLRAFADGATIVLRWTTGSETNNAGFEIQQRRIDEPEAAFAPVAFVVGHGTTTQTETYTHRLPAQTPGTVALRLRQIDYDGTDAFSPTVEVTVRPSSVASGHAYPNPFNPLTTFRFSVPTTQTVHVAAYDIHGRRVATLYDGVLAGGQQHTVPFDAASLAGGLYVLRAEGPTVQVTTPVLLAK